jgi:uncharacterized membrane protein YhaH (DUF805 family)
VNWYFFALKRFPDEGRSCRAEYWWFTLVSSVSCLVISFVELVLYNESQLFSGIFALLHIPTAVLVSVRRMHDVDRSGWWILLPPVSFVFACLPGTPWVNQFGPEAPLLPGKMRATAETTAPARKAFAEGYDVIAEVERLAALRARGGLSEAEFEVMKADALSRGRGA